MCDLRMFTMIDLFFNIRTSNCRLMKNLIIPFIAFFMFCFSVSATHIKGGYIGIKEIRGNTVVFQFIGFRDVGSVVGFGAGIFRFGDGSSIESNFDIQKEQLDSNTEKVSYVVEHTYSGSGTYTAEYFEEYRSENIINLDKSFNKLFSTSLTFLLDPFLSNALPKVNIDHLLTQQYSIGHKSEHALIANDQNGDLLVFDLFDPKKYTYPLPNYVQPPIDMDRLTGSFLLDLSSVDNASDHSQILVVVAITEYRRINGVLQFLSRTVLDFNIELSDHSESSCHPTINIDPISCGSNQEEVSIEIIKGECEQGLLSFNFEGYVLENADPAIVSDQALLNDTIFTVYPENSTKSYQYGSVQYTDGEQSISQSLLLTDDCDSNEDLVKLVTSEFVEEKFSLFPNPSNGVFKLSTTTSGTLRIISLNGKQILNQAVSNDVLTLDISQTMEAGTYIAQYFDQQNRLIGIKRIVIIQ